MTELNVHLDLSFGARTLRVLMAAGMLFAGASELSSENVTMSTYYPAPSGVYTQMITTGNTFLARDSGGLAVGTANAPAGTTKMVVMGGNVGIGTAGPASTLSVNGGVQLGNDASACTVAKEGTLRWNSGNLETCKSLQWTRFVPPPALSIITYWQSAAYPMCHGYLFTPAPGSAVTACRCSGINRTNWWPSRSCYITPSLPTCWSPFPGNIPLNGCTATQDGVTYTW